MIEIINCDQGTQDWFEARMGIPTASEFSTILAKGRSGTDSRTRRTYLLKLAGERLTGEPMERYSNHHLERGKAMEAEARAYYELRTDRDTVQVGFIRSGDKGCSPDSLIGADGMLEIKTTLPHLLIEHLLKNEFPPEHKAQTQGQLWVAHREWVDLSIYWPGMPNFIKRAYRDEAYIATLSEAVDQFNDELFATVEKIRAYGLKEAA